MNNRNEQENGQERSEKGREARTDAANGNAKEKREGETVSVRARVETRRAAAREGTQIQMDCSLLLPRLSGCKGRGGTFWPSQMWEMGKRKNK